jgi:phosphate transport system substrate-binding protein
VKTYLNGTKETYVQRRIAASIIAAVALAALTLTPAAASSRAGNVTINGSGSSFDAPLFSNWATRYTAASLNYQSLGSGTGQSQLNEQLTDFGAFDVPMLASDDFSNFSKITQFPITLGGEAIEYNLPDYTGTLKLTGNLIGEIYLGHIKKWTDPKLEKLNPGLKKLAGKPDQTITVVHRSDSSGTTYIFTDFLSRTNKTWAKNPALGASKLPAWPVGVGGSHSTGVDAAVEGTPGAIGYVEYAYLLQNKRAPAAIQNQAGKFIKPSLKGVVAEAAARKRPITTTSFSIVYLKGKSSYPISGFSWAGVYTKGSDWHDGTSLCTATKAFFHWATTTGQKGVGTSPLFYASLPKNVAAYSAAQQKKVHCSS